jgi:hypothetical protein
VNLFYEVLQPDGLPKYYSAYDVSTWWDLGYNIHKLMWDSHRIWKEDDAGQVKLVKNSDPASLPADQTPIDKKEFFLIKLKSKSI